MKLKIIRACFFALIITGMFYLAKTVKNETFPTTPVSLVEPFVEKGVYIEAKAYSSQESRQKLSYDLLHWNFQPVELIIQNNTATTFFLSSAGVETSLATAQDVALHVSSSSIPRGIVLKILGFFFWPIMIPATIDSIFTLKSHLDMRTDFHTKTIKEEGEQILPYSTAYRVIFVPIKHYEEQFTLYLQDASSQYLFPYPVSVHK